MEHAMEWLKNRTMYVYVLAGIFFGTVLFSLGVWLEFTKQRLPIAPWAFSYVHRTNPMIIAMDLAPILFGIVGGLIGTQRELLSVIQRGKREWEVIFDSISDPILVLDENDLILRCNRALITRLNQPFGEVIGRNFAEVLQIHQRFDQPRYSFNWLDRTYDVSSSMLLQGELEQKKLVIFHDITDRKQAETTLEQTEALFRALLDLLPDAVVEIDPNDAEAA